MALSLPTSKLKINRVGHLYGASLALVLSQYCLEDDNRPLSKPAVESKLRGDSERRTGVSTQVHEDSSTESRKQVASADGFGKRSNINLIITTDNHTANQLAAELKFFTNQQDILLFPDWETLPYDHFSPHQDIISERLKILNKLQSSNNLIIIAAISTLMHRLCPKKFINQNSLVLEIGGKLSIDNFRTNLNKSGYYCVNTVLERGEFSVRGSIIDVFPMGSKLPFRIELFDDEIDTLRTFDPETQKTIEKINAINILPAREVPLDKDSITLFRNNFRNQFNVNPSQCSIYTAISDGKFSNGIEYYLALFFTDTATIFDYLPQNTKLYLIEDTYSAAEQFHTEVTTRYEQVKANIYRPTLETKQCFLNPTDFFTAAGAFKQIRLQHKPVTNGINFNVEKAKALPVNRRSNVPLSKLADYISDSKQRYLIVVESAGRQEMLIELLKQSYVYPHKYASWHDFINGDDNVGICIGPLNYGAEITDLKLCIIVESQLFGEQTIAPRKISESKIIDPDTIIKDLVELQIGAPVVHLEYGVGRYQGLQTLTDNNMEFLTISYANEDKIYVPITSLHLINRYTGADSEHAPLHSLRSDQWQKEKQKAITKIHDVAIELLEIYAKREARKGFEYHLKNQDYQIFASGFAFSETPDQTNAIQEIIQDMCSDKPMDRLICGDVGFGKTEVAMRAAFIATQNSKQVCVLTPTTLLADQHFNSFTERFIDFPINIELLSRFRTGKEANKVTTDLASGKIDIIIGTHKLIQNEIKFKNLGLLIIDEEHRFGVKQKEHIKKFRSEVDILCMTATPIPRTLNLSMAGIRDVSLIASPPAKRLSIKTFWQKRADSIIKEAILRETLRGGQVFFLHNNVTSIHKILDEVTRLVPEAKAKIAHGQMRETELERIMSDFYHHKFNVLICTTIIETGIDIPTANTIIIDRADKFGLAQLHQLRGRVGRSHHQAYAYLLTPDEKIISEDAKKRLTAIVTYDDLGAGFSLATLDMEIRGAGELLGKNQSGHMHAVGFNLYMEMLDKAVEDLKQGKTPELSMTTSNGAEVDLRIPAIIPASFIGDIHQRLIIYKRIANAKHKSNLHDLQIELIDRFGLLPTEVKLLFDVTELKIYASQIGVKKINASHDNGYIEFGASPKINPAELVKLIQVHSSVYKLNGPNKLSFTLSSDDPKNKIQSITETLNKLEQK